MERPLISVLLTGLNDSGRLGKCISSIKSCDFYKKDYEIVYVDGGSSDNSVEIAKKLGSRIFVKSKFNRPEGRNFGIKKAKGKILAFTDTDCVVDKNWLKEIKKELSKEDVFAVGGPNLIPKVKTWFEGCISAALNTRIGSLGSVSGFIRDERINVRSIAANNAAYKKEIIKKVGIFDEKLITGEDPDMNLRIRKKGFEIIYDPKMKVWHPRRSTLKEFLKQMYYYGVGRMKLIKKHKFIPDVIYYFPLALIPAIMFLIYNFSLTSSLLLVLFLIFYLSLLFEILLKNKKLSLSFVGPFFLSLGYFAYILGYYKEVIRS